MFYVTFTFTWMGGLDGRMDEWGRFLDQTDARRSLSYYYHNYWLMDGWMDGLVYVYTLLYFTFFTLPSLRSSIRTLIDWFFHSFNHSFNHSTSPHFLLYYIIHCGPFSSAQFSLVYMCLCTRLDSTRVWDLVRGFNRWMMNGWMDKLISIMVLGHLSFEWISREWISSGMVDGLVWLMNELVWIGMVDWYEWYRTVRSRSEVLYLLLVDRWEWVGKWVGG